MSGVLVAALCTVANGDSSYDGGIVREKRSFGGANQWSGQSGTSWQQGGQRTWGQPGNTGSFGAQGQRAWSNTGGFGAQRQGAWGNKGSFGAQGQGSYGNTGGFGGAQGPYGFTPYDTPKYYGYDSNYPGGRTHFIFHRTPSRGGYGGSQGGGFGGYGSQSGGGYRGTGANSGWGQQASQWG